MKKIYFVIMASVLHQQILVPCPLKIENDDMHDIIIVDQLKATLIRSNKKGTVGLNGKTNVAIYRAQRQAKDCNDFVVNYLVTEKECPSEAEIKNNKKINSFKLSTFATRSKTDLDEQKRDGQRFVVEDVMIKKNKK